MYLFVYGTLKQGQSRNRYLAGQEFVGPARTQLFYRLYNLGSYPGLVSCADGLSITGELWKVSEACLEMLDRVEGCDEGLYRREPVALAPPHDGIAAVTYLYQPGVDGLLECGTCW